MIKFVIKRLLSIIPMMLVIIFIVFALVSMSRVDVGRNKLGADASEEDVYAYNEELGLYDPLVVRYGRYIAGICRGDFGTSYYYNEPVMKIGMEKPSRDFWSVTSSKIFATISALFEGNGETRSPLF